MSPSLLDPKFLLLLTGLIAIRPAIPARHYIPFCALGSATLMAVASLPTFLVISAITLLILFPLQLSKQRSLLSLGIALMVALLCLYKIVRQFPVVTTRLVDEIAAVFGFSYFILRAISFLRIQALAPMTDRRPWPLLYYTLYPSTITSGPIHKFQDFKTQLAAPLPFTVALLQEAVYRITRGFFRKLVLAYLLDQLSSRMLAPGNFNVLSSTAVITVLYLFFYFDFAGYSDIAIGFGMLLGIKPPENFRKPFQATTVSEFWRNWHISLVDWFRENVFIPLGGMRGSKKRAAGLALLIMVLCGAWHGLSVNFLLWGTWHGAALFTEALAGSKPVPPASRHGPYYLWRVFWTNARVALPSILFLPKNDDILAILKGLTHLGFY